MNAEGIPTLGPVPTPSLHPAGAKPLVLLVDDDVLLLRALQRVLSHAFDIITADSGEAALAYLKEPRAIAVVVSDMRMPGMDGIRFLDQWRFLSPDTTRVMLTGQADLTTAMDAVNQGQVFRFVTKPVDGRDLQAILRDAASQYELVTAEHTLLEGTLTGSVQVLVDMLSMLDPKGFGRAKEERDLAVAMARECGLDAEWDVAMAALVGRIGWLALPLEVQTKLHRGERLTLQEQEMHHRSPEVGAQMLAAIPRLQPVARIIRYSSKDFNGGGAPHDRVAGQDIPIASRILRIVHDFVAKLHVRQSPVVVFADLELGASRKYDPELLQLLGGLLKVHDASAARVGSMLLSVDDLEPGMTLVKDVYTSRNEMLLLPGGTRLNLLHIERLRNYSAGRMLEGPILIDRMA
ncbi:MAG: response regulator [Holophagaceae bacterium]|nr:response regulator [Holophagaceae bacterium]